MKRTIAWMTVAGGLVLPGAYAHDEGMWDSTQTHLQGPHQTSGSAFGRADSGWDSTRAHVPPHVMVEQHGNATLDNTEEWDTTRRHVREVAPDATRTRQISE